MSLKIDFEVAKATLDEEARKATTARLSGKWVALIEKLSQACEGTSKTHIAFLGTAILAKAVDTKVDVYARKAGASTPGAYDARSLCHKVLVPSAPQLGIDLGVTGREPLNNQPYFRILRAIRREILPLVKDKKPVEVMLEILGNLEHVTALEAREALRAFISVRRKYCPQYGVIEVKEGSVVPEILISAVERFSQEKSEGGKRAQSIAAGMMDMFAGAERTESGRVNDPSRHVPGDVGVRSLLSADSWDRVFEVRDKPITESDLIIFTRHSVREKVTKAAVLAVSSQQQRFPLKTTVELAQSMGITLTVFWSWHDFISQTIFWSGLTPVTASTTAAECIRNRLVESEVAVESVRAWDALIGIK